MSNTVRYIIVGEYPLVDATIDRLWGISPAVTCTATPDHAAHSITMASAVADTDRVRG